MIEAGQGAIANAVINLYICDIPKQYVHDCTVGRRAGQLNIFKLQVVSAVVCSKEILSLIHFILYGIPDFNHCFVMIVFII